jgi:hypothetical protein
MPKKRKKSKKALLEEAAKEYRKAHPKRIFGFRKGK